MVAAASARVCEALVPAIPPAAIVAGYERFRGELDIRPAMLILGERGHTLCLPVIEAPDKPLFFRRWRAEDVLEQGRYGIPIPPAGAPVFRPHVIVVPLVAFDRAGHRLGYGAGYYDRTIARLREAGEPLLVIGVGYSQQEVERIPVGPHDQKLDIMITEKETIRVAV